MTQVPCTFSFDLNAGTVTLAGAFPNLPPSVDFTVEFAKEFDGGGERTSCSIPSTRPTTPDT